MHFDGLEEFENSDTDGKGRMKTGWNHEQNYRPQEGRMQRTQDSVSNLFYILTVGVAVSIVGLSVVNLICIHQVTETLSLSFPFTKDNWEILPARQKT